MMKKTVLVFALLPAIALAGPGVGRGPGPGPGPGPGAGPGAGPDPVQIQRMVKRIRLAATLGLAEVLDLDDQATMRVRDVIARYSDRRMPLQQQLRTSMIVVRDAARGDQAAAGQLDAALGRIRDVRAQITNLDNELFQQVTQGLSPEKKAKAALFLARFRERARHMAMMHGGPGWGPGWRHGDGPGFGPRGGFEEGMAPGRGGRRGMMMGPGVQRDTVSMGDGNEPELDDLYAGE